MGNDTKQIFALRLRQFAVELSHIKNAIERVAEFDDDDFSPSRYTPSRAQSRDAMHKLSYTVSGYCIAADDAFDRGHGTTEQRWYTAIDNGLTYPQPVDIPDSDSGYSTAAEGDANYKADKAFGDYLWSDVI